MLGFLAGEDSEYHESLIVTSIPLVAGTAAMRNTKRGSWYIEALTQVFSERACDMHVADMLVKVSQLRLSPQTFVFPQHTPFLFPCTIFHSLFTIPVVLYYGSMRQSQTSDHWFCLPR
jgi:hypothetical protein